MSSESTPFNLSLYYQDILYKHSELIQNALQQFPNTSFASSSAIAVNSANVFQVTLALLQGLLNQQCVFPVADDFSQAKVSALLTQLEKINHSSVAAKTALAVMTSGSQSESKIALISFKNIYAHCHAFLQQVPMNSASLWLNCMPLVHIAGLMIVYRCALSQAAILLHQGFNACKIWQDLFQYPVTHISLVPAMLAQLLDIQDKAKVSVLPESLQYVIVGGDRLAPGLYEQALARGWPLLISYGMTEATSTIALGKQADQLIPLKGFQLRTDSKNILDIKGDMVISRYLHDGQSYFDRGWFKTSDRVSIKQGRLEVIGRNDHIIISGGENYNPETIEALLLKAPMIRDIAVGSTTHDIWGHTIVALVTLTHQEVPSAEADIKALKNWTEKHIKSSCQPRIFIPVTRIPRTQLGKIDRCNVQLKINVYLSVNKS